MESVVSMARVDDRSDRRMAEILANQDRPLLIHAESMNPFTLRFKDPGMETAYHQHFTGSWGKFETKVEAPTYSVVVDILVATVVFSLISVVAWIVFGVRFSAWVVYFTIATAALVLFLIYFIATFWRSKRLIPLVTYWYPRHIVALLLIELPIGAALANLAFACFNSVVGDNLLGASDTSDPQATSSSLPDVFTTGSPTFAAPTATTAPNQLVVFYIGFALLLAHCNFSQISHWMKSGFALLLGITLVLLVCVGGCPCFIVSESVVANSANPASVVANEGARVSVRRSVRETSSIAEAGVGNIITGSLAGNSNIVLRSLGTETTVEPTIGLGATFSTTPARASTKSSNNHEEPALAKLEFFHGRCLFRWECILDVILALLLVAFLNRQFESIFRMSFYGDIQAVRDMEKMKVSKDQADWLLSNIIPDFVLVQLKANSKYSENNELVAVMFASILNWNQFYEESYKGGREFLRVLNEIIGDFDALLDEPQFNQIEKIKTIGSTYMAASGLNPEKRAAAKSPNEHLIQLMDFALAIQDKLARFNEDMLSFEFIMKIGYNIGPVTAGVIGTTKLYYDIWGDTVNIASRMYSTGIPRRIQVSDRCIEKLGDHFQFEFRDHIDVKGIDGGMDVFLLEGRNQTLQGETPQDALLTPGSREALASTALPTAH